MRHLRSAARRSWGPGRHVVYAPAYAPEALERRRLLAATTFVNDNWHFLSDVDASSSLTVGDLVRNDNDTINPGIVTVTYGVDGFGTVTSGSFAGSVAGAATINNAIAATDAAGTLNVLEGTYVELVTANKTLSLRGAQSGVDARTRTGVAETVIRGADLGGGTRSSSFFVSANDVVIDGFVVQDNTSSAQFGAGIVLGTAISGSEVRNNIIQDNITGLFLANNNAANPATIERNLFRNNNQSGPTTGTGIYSDQFIAGGTLAGVVIADNTFSGHTGGVGGIGQGINLSSTNPAAPASNFTITDNLFDANSRALVAFNLTASLIVDNTMRNSTDATSADIRLFEGTNDLTIERNVLQNGAGRALRISNIGTGAADATDVTFQFNSVSGYTGPAGTFQVDDDAYAGTLDATCNWWGDITGPTIASNPGGAGQTISDVDAFVDFQPWLVYAPDANAAVPGVQFVTSFSVPAQTSGFTTTNNNYRRLVNVVDCLQSGQTVTLSGAFDWTEANAAAAWALGNDGSAAGGADNFSLQVPINLNNVTLTAASLGTARIQGPGDLAAQNLEGFLVFDGGDNQNWTISNLEIFDFDLSIGMFNGAGGADAYNGTTIANNRIRVPADLNSTVAPADVNQNIGIHFSFGVNQTIADNEIQFAGNGVSDSGALRFASSVGMQSNVSGGNVYDGLLIDGNTLRVLDAQSADPEQIFGIWENGHAHSSDITVSDNDFINDAAGNDSALNRQRAFRVTSHSSATTVVAYTGNSADGANIGFEWLASSNFAGNQPVRLANNTLSDNDTAVLIQSNGLANLYRNTITGSGAGGGVRVLSGELASAGAVTNAVEQNVISGGSGVGIHLAAGVTVSGGIFNNDLGGNTGLAVNNLTGNLVNASGNWWGTNTAAGVAGEVSADVDYTPWLDAGTDTAAGTSGFQGDFAALHVDDTSPQSGATGRINEGIGLASGATPTVLIESGTYAESVAANKAALTLDGVSGTAADVVIDPASGDGITVSANNVTLRDLRVTGAANGISATGVSGLTLNNVTSDTNTSVGVNLSSLTGTTTLTDVTSTGNTSDGLIVNGGATVNISGGAYSNNSNDGISLQGITTASVTNVTANLNTGIVADGLEAANITTLNVTGGSFTNNADEGIDLLLGIATGTIDGSTLTGNGDLGLAVGQSGGGNTTLNLLGLTITGNTGGGGSINNVTTLNFTGTTGSVDDAITLGGSSGTQTLQHTRDPLGTPVVNQSLSLSSVNALAVNGDGGNDQLDVSFASGNPVPTGGLSFAGGGESAAPGDALRILGGTFTTVTYTFTADTADGGPFSANGHNGSVNLDGSVINFTGLEPLTNTGTSTVSIFNLPDDAQDNQAILEDDANLANGMVRLRSGNGTFETTTFTNPTFNTRVNASDDGETLTLARLDNGFVAFVDFFGSTGNDTYILDFSSGVNVIPTVGPNQSAFVGDTGTDAISILGGYSATNVDYTFGDIQGLDLGPQAGTISIDGRAVSYQDVEPAGGITDGLVSTNRSFTFDNGLVGSKVVTIADDATAANSRSRLSTDAATATPPVVFRHPTTLLTVTGTDSAETFNVNGLDSANRPTTLRLNGQGAGDTFNVTPLTTTSVAVDGDLPTPAGAAPRDTLNVEFTGVTTPGLTSSSSASGFSGTYTFGNRQPITFQEIETFTPLPASLFFISDFSKQEGHNSTKKFRFNVTRSNGVGTASVQFTTAPGTATAGSDYVSRSGTVTFAPGQTSRTVEIDVNGDRTVEANETFFVNLSSPVNGAISDGQGVGTIENDDPVALTALTGTFGSATLETDLLDPMVDALVVDATGR